MVTIGVDTGGTFTDFIFKDGDNWVVFKLPSTPSNPAEAVLSGLDRLAGKQAKRVVHGSTVATNAILERKGVRTVLITNKGFEDVIEIGRQNRTRLYDLAYQKEPHIVPADRRFGVRCRVFYNGEVLRALDPDDAREVIELVRRQGAESVAVCFLHSFANPSHEKEMKELMAPLDVPVSLSHEVLAEFREYERTSTTVVNAYVSPIMRKYILHLVDSFGEGDKLGIMQSNGGSISAETAMKESVRTILSGPAGGAVGALELGRMAGYDRIITFDMGGTSTDVSLIDKELSLTFESAIGGYPVKVPMLGIHTVGAGGGSIAYLDSGGALKVGPESAGADPGPLCYGKGDRITVTDANLYLGRLVPEYFLGGGMKIRVDLLDEQFRKMSKQAGLSPVELAEGILAVANATMERAIRVISVERGYDPREFALYSFGGAGGMHAAFLAKSFEISHAVVPRNPGILSAIGMLMADVLKDYSLTVMLNQHNTDRERLSELFVAMKLKGIADLVSEGLPSESIRLEEYLDMRYQGQSYEIMVPFGDNYVEGFHRLHEKTYGYRNRAKTVEIVNIRLRARGVPEKPIFGKVESGSQTPPREALVAEHRAVFDSREWKTSIIDREKLLGGNRIRGPAIVVEYSATTVIPPFAEALVDEYGNLVIETGCSITGAARELSRPMPEVR